MTAPLQTALEGRRIGEDYNSNLSGNTYPVKPEVSTHLVGSDARNIKAITATVCDSTRVLIKSRNGLVSIAEGVLSSVGPRLSGAEIESLIESGFMRSAPDAIRDDPAGVLAWVLWVIQSDHRLRSSRRMGVYAR